MEVTSPKAIDEWLRDLNLLLREGRANAPVFLKPLHLVTMSLGLKENGTTSLTLPDRLTRYAARMGVWESVGLQSPVVVKKHHAGDRFCEISRLVLRQDVHRVANRLAEVAFSNQPLPLDKPSSDSLLIALSELTENCHAHARVGDGLHGLACAQAWQHGGRAQIAIADSGIGLRASLTENPDTAALLFGANAAEVATRYGVSSKPELGHKGYGLTLARGLAEQNCESMLYVHSHGEVLAVSNGEVTSYRCADHESFRGTFVVFEWSIVDRLDVAKVYASWPKAEGDDEDDFEFN